MAASEGKEIPKEKSEAIMVDLVGDNSKESTAGDEDLTKVGMDETALNEERLPPAAVTEALKRRSSVGHSIRRSQSGKYQVWSLNQFYSDDSLNNQGSVCKCAFSTKGPSL